MNKARRKRGMEGSREAAWEGKDRSRRLEPAVPLATSRPSALAPALPPALPPHLLDLGAFLNFSERVLREQAVAGKDVHILGPGGLADLGDTNQGVG
jgi:hypothetical protein